jgi:ribonuclease HIII
MVDKISTNLAALENFLSEKGWRVFSQKMIDHGLQVVVTDGAIRVPVSFYNTGRILVQGKPCEMRDALTEWANLLQAGFAVESPDKSVRRDRVAKYLVIPDNIEKIREVVRKMPGEVLEKEVGGPAEVYRFEVRYEGHRVTITQYTSGTLLVQGLSSPHFDTVCEILDEHLAQSFSERATRFFMGEKERAAAVAYLEMPDAENEATRWLLEQLKPSGLKILEFLYENDRRTLLAAAGVRNAAQELALADYSVVVMPFAKVLEGFLIRLAVHLGLTKEDALEQKADEITVGAWVDYIKKHIPDPKRHSAVCAALEDAWQCRHKVIHSDFAHPLSTLPSFSEAEREVAVILRAILRAYQAFVEEGIKLIPGTSPDESKPNLKHESTKQKFEGVDRETLRKRLEADGYSVAVQSQEDKRNVWEIIGPDLKVIAPRKQDGLVIVEGPGAAEFCEKYRAILSAELARIGVDESGKGDVFGPLVVAGVLLTSDTEMELARRGVRDSKTLSDAQILELARTIRDICQYEVGSYRL